jgi:DNA-directed RNA polymerase subunit L
MVETLAREIRKLEVRVERFTAAEESFLKELRKCLARCTEFNQNIERAGEMSGPDNIQSLSSLRLLVIEALNETLKKGSAVEHEKSHLLESYGALIVSVERAFEEVT